MALFIYYRVKHYVINIEPYSAERRVNLVDDNGLHFEWRPCRVLGITMLDGRPEYIIEEYDSGERWLETADIVRTKH